MPGLTKYPPPNEMYPRSSAEPRPRLSQYPPSRSGTASRIEYSTPPENSMRVNLSSAVRYEVKSYIPSKLIEKPGLRVGNTARPWARVRG